MNQMLPYEYTNNIAIENWFKKTVVLAIKSLLLQSKLIESLAASLNGLVSVKRVPNLI